MRWKPVSEGPKYQDLLEQNWGCFRCSKPIPTNHDQPCFVSAGVSTQDFRELWSKMRATDVLSEEARARYGIDSFRIPLDEATVPPITDAGFVDPSLALDLYEPFLFDALYAFVIAINTLLNGGVPLEEIKGDRLLNQLRITEFEGISGLVSFDQYGDRQASYELVNLHPDGLRVAALYRGVEDQLVVAAGSVYWVGGMRVDQPPSFLTDCGPGSYKDELLGQCVPCTRGFQCINGTQELCPKGTFSNVSGATFCRNCSKGSFYGDLGSTRCTSCQAGFYADEEGLETCRRCPKGTYVSALHAESCFDCGMNQITEESGSQLQSDCRCAQGTFMCDTGPSLGCLTCPEGLLCATGLDPPVHQPGYWTSADDTCRFKVLKRPEILVGWLSNREYGSYSVALMMFNGDYSDPFGTTPPSRFWGWQVLWTGRPCTGAEMPQRAGVPREDVARWLCGRKGRKGLQQLQAKPLPKRWWYMCRMRSHWLFAFRALQSGCSEPFHFVARLHPIAIWDRCAFPYMLWIPWLDGWIPHVGPNPRLILQSRLPKLLGLAPSILDGNPQDGKVMESDFVWYYSTTLKDRKATPDSKRVVDFPSFLHLFNFWGGARADLL